MRNKIIFIGFLYLLIIPLASANPVIQDIDIKPSENLWLEENANITLKCYDDENNTIKNVYADITCPNEIIIQDLPFEPYNNKYVYYFETDSLASSGGTGQYDATVYCVNNISNKTSDLISFKISELKGKLEIDTPIYIGDKDVEVKYTVKIDDEPLSYNENVTFEIKIDNDLEYHLLSYDNINKRWILTIDTPSIGSHELKIAAFYDRTSVSDTVQFEVRENVEFEIVSIDDNWVEVNDNITVTLKALEKGSVIELDEDNLNIKIASTEAKMTTINKNGNLFDVKIIAPSISSGKHKLHAYLSHNGSSYSDSKQISYIVPVKGKIVDANNKGMSVRLIFLQNDVEKLNIVTDSYGHYSGSLAPETYDLEITFPKSTIVLYETIINEFDDPIKYFYSDDFDVPGIRNAGLYNYEIALSYSEAEIEMDYKEKRVLNEDNLKIFKCSNWNSGRRVCNDYWEEIGGEIDIVRNKARITSSTLSAFVIGEIKGLNVDFSLDKEEYYLDDLIKVRGIVKDENGKSVSNASVNVQVENTEIDSDTFTDKNGVFSITFSAPEEEGNYTIDLKTERQPYKPFSTYKNFEVVKSESIYINFPDTVRIAIGDNFTQEFGIINTGQAGLYDLNISLEGIPENYYSLISNLIDLETEEKKTLYINFFIPEYAEKGITSATLKINSDGFYQEKVFGFNLFERSKNITSTAPTGFGITFPKINYMDIIYIILFATVCFSTAIILKKVKSRKPKRSEIKEFLFDVKNYLRKNEIRSSGKRKLGPYDDLISSEFPKQKNKFG